MSGSGTATIAQAGCSISYNPVSQAGLIGSNLTPSQLQALTRTGTVSGSNVTVTGLLALIDTVASSQAGYTAVNVSTNILTATGQVTGNVITLNETGTLVVSGAYSIDGQRGSFSETVTTSSTAVFKRIVGPTITSVTVANGGTTIAQNTWIVIKGVNLVPPTTPAAGVIWSTAPDFAQGRMPTQLGGVGVTVDGNAAFVYFYCSAATSTICASDQINVLTPLDSKIGPVSIVVTNNGTSTTAFTADLAWIAPTFLQFGATGYVVATHGDGALLGPTTLYPGASTPAQPGEPIVVYGVGFGLPTTALVNGSSTQSAPLPELPVCQIGGTTALVEYAGVISPGSHQVNLTVPRLRPDGRQFVELHLLQPDACRRPHYSPAVTQYVGVGIFDRGPRTGWLTAHDASERPDPGQVYRVTFGTSPPRLGRIRLFRKVAGARLFRYFTLVQVPPIPSAGS